MMRTGRRGNYAWIFVLSVFVVLGFGAMGIDFFRLQAARAQAQNTADAAAMAALIAFKSSGDTADAESAATYISEQNFVGDAFGGMEVVIDWGTWDFELDKSTAWDGSGAPINAVKARIGRTESSFAGEFPYILAPVLGFDSIELWGTSYAALRYREVVVVLDITGSFVDEFDEAREAVVDFLDTLHDSTMPGDQIGLVTFVGGAEVYTDLQSLSDGYDTIRADWENLSTCHLWDEMYNNFYSYIDVSFDGETTWTPMSQSDFVLYMGNDAPHMSPCYIGSDEEPLSYAESVIWGNGAQPYYKESGTSQGHGIELATSLLNDSGDDHATKVIVLISDGLPQCTGEGDTCDTWRSEFGLEAAETADDEHGISIFSVSFNDPADSDQTDYMQSLTTGHGEFYETPDPSELPQILQTIANAIPTTVVR